MGKTALALFLTKHAALAGDAVLFFSLEMAAWRLADRLILGETGINSHSYRHGTIDQTDNEKIYQIADQFSTLPIFIDEQSSPTIDYIIASSRLAVRKYKAKLIVIDYLQLMNMREQRGQTRDQAIGLVTRKLKQLAKELQLPVILLSQLNRSLESRSSRVPTLADLRESGNIEQDADMVLLLFRPAYYNLSDFRDHETNNILWILTEKFRDGDAKDIIIRHNDNPSDFYNYD
jgi:replicative DNA helicase